MKTRRGVVRGRTPKERGPEAGGRIPSFPQTGWRPSTRTQGGSARESAKPRHLGASSHSGNVRGGCRGWSPLGQRRKIVEW